jgi:hypothetical protein
MWQALSAAARQAMEEGRQSHGKVLWLLADACSMMLSPKSNNEPFKPFFVMEGRRSAIPDDLAVEDIIFFSEISDLIDDVWLKARIADLVWLRKRNLGTKFALDAIDAYSAIPLDGSTWVFGVRECWGRAISLCLMLGAGSGNRKCAIENAVLSAFDSATISDGFWAYWLAELLAEHRLGHAKREHIATSLLSFGHQFDVAGDLHRARSYFDAAVIWFKKFGDAAKAADATVKVAETCVKESVSQLSQVAAASLYEKAIQVYRTIPRADRGVHKVEERISELHSRMNEAGLASIGEMKIITSSNMDITELVAKSREAVSGKSTKDALFAFANIYPGVQVASVRVNAEKILKQSLMRQFFGGTYLSRDGRVIAKKPATGFGHGDTGDDQSLWAQMVHDYQILVNLVVEADIWPAHEVMIREHRLRESDFISLANRSPIVPAGRDRLFGKALCLGYEQDFVGALHLLVPQIEHMVRSHLKCAGGKTTNLDKESIENENGLSTLAELPEMVLVFGDDLTFEFKALFCSPFGPNLRNELAHGLLDYEDCHSHAAIYAWWFALRLVFKTFWNAGRSSSDSGASDASSGGQ